MASRLSRTRPFSDVEMATLRKPNRKEEGMAGGKGGEGEQEGAIGRNGWTRGQRGAMGSVKIVDRVHT